LTRIEKVTQAMREEGIDGLLLTGEANVRYVSGFTSGDSYVILTEKGLFFLTDSRYTEQAAQECGGFSVVDYRRDASTLEETIAAGCSDLGIKRLGFEKEIVAYSLYESIRTHLDRVDFVPTQGIVEGVRIVKEEAEIQILKKAAAIAAAALTDLIPLIKPGLTEQDIQRELEYLLMKNGASGTAFPTIVASGPRSSLPHGAPSQRSVEQGDFITIDFGALYQGYCSDMTRTIAIGRVSEEQRKIYDVVKKAQETALAGIRPGMTGAQIDKLARDVIKEAGYGEYFGHALGHSVGLEIHESPNFYPREETVIRPGMVITVEPGIYVEGVGGVRIEDVVVITEDGCENITHSAKEWIEVEE